MYKSRYRVRSFRSRPNTAMLRRQSMNVSENKKRGYFLKATLLIMAAFLLLISILFAKDAGDSSMQESLGEHVTYKTVDPLIDASGVDILQETTVIYGGDIVEIDFTNTEVDKVAFDVSENLKHELLQCANEGSRQFMVGVQGPQILIYHTHTQEAYRQIFGKEYIEVGEFRSNNDDYSVVAVGDALRQELNEYGFSVLHDTTNHEPPKLNTSYSRSIKTIEKYQRDYSTLSVFIDVHRDAYGDVETGKKDIVMVDGDECARVMFVVGVGEGFDDKSDYESNFTLALALTKQLESIQKGFTRPIRVRKRSHNYNQHVSDMCVLIEVGHNANSLEQAKNTAKYVALALSRVLSTQMMP